MKNKYLFMFVLLLVIVLSSTCVFAENNTGDLSYVENTDNSEYDTELESFDDYFEETNVDSVDSRFNNSADETYFKDKDGNYILTDGSYFNNLIDEIENSDKESVRIMLNDNVKLNEIFVWNNTRINLTICGYNGTDIIWENEFARYPFYILSTPSIIVGENSNLELSEINLLSNRLKDSNFIVNNGELVLYDVLLTDNIGQPGSIDESYLIFNNAKLSLEDFFNTANYSTNETRRNLLYNKGELVTDFYWSDTAIYRHDFDVDEPNYYIYNTGQVKYLYINLKNTIIESDSDYEYDVIYDYLYFTNEKPDVYGDNVLINNSILETGANFNSNNITLLNSWSDISYFNDIPVFKFNVTNIKIKNCKFTNTIFTNNTINAENIILDSNTFEFNENFEKYTDLKIKDYNEVKLIYDHLTNTNNTLNNFKFIMSDIPSNQTNKTNDDITPSNDTKTNEDNTPTNNTQTNEDITPTNDKKEVKQNLKVNNIPKKNSSFKGYSFNHNTGIITLSQNTDITLSWLNNLFNNYFNNDTLLIYINGVLVFNGSVGEDLSQVLFHISDKYHGSYTLKVVTNSGDVYIKEIYIE